MTELHKSLVTVHHSSDEQGLGFLSKRGFILTAAHCLPGQPRPAGMLADTVEVQVSSFLDPSVQAVVHVTFAEPVSDVAVLAMGADLDAFCDLQESLQPVPLHLDVFRDKQDIEVLIPTHEGKILEGAAEVFLPWQSNATVQFSDPNERVKGGTSGAPAFTAAGRVLGIVNWGPEQQAECNIVLLATALPASTIIQHHPELVSILDVFRKG